MDLSNAPVTPSEPPKRARTPRHTEWTRTKMIVFLRELAATQSVSAAAAVVGMSRTSAYKLRNKLTGSPFALGWEVALELGYVQLAQAVMDRAVNGVEVQHFYHGELVGATRHYDNVLARWVLENPWKVGRQQMAREYSAGDFEALLERIEHCSLGWEPGEALPGPGWPHLEGEEARAAEEAFAASSWYADAAREGVKVEPPKREW